MEELKALASTYAGRVVIRIRSQFEPDFMGEKLTIEEIRELMLLFADDTIRWETVSGIAQIMYSNT